MSVERIKKLKCYLLEKMKMNSIEREKALKKLEVENKMLKQSKNWDMDITFENLVNHNQKCKIDRNYKGHWSDNGIDGMCLYMQHPNSERCDTIITVSEDGACYDGNGGTFESLEYVDTNKALSELIEHKNKNK